MEPIRQRLDPRQYAIIPAHVTLCRDDELLAWQEIGPRLAALGEFAILMQFGEPQVLADGCLLLRPTHGMEQYRELRRAVLGASANAHDAHITLLHPRHAAGVAYNLSDIAPKLAGLKAIFRTVALIEQHSPGPWLVRREFGAIV